MEPILTTPAIQQAKELQKAMRLLGIIQIKINLYRNEEGNIEIVPENAETSLKCKPFDFIYLSTRHTDRVLDYLFEGKL